jgi:hypothetical protein
LSRGVPGGPFSSRATKISCRWATDRLRREKRSVDEADNAPFVFIRALKPPIGPASSILHITLGALAAS